MLYRNAGHLIPYSYIIVDVARMVDNAAQQPLLSGLLDPTPQTNKKDAPKRRFRHCCFYLVNPGIGGKRTDGLLDAVYFCIVTMTTVGYGDLVPIDYLVERQETALVKALYMREKVGQAEILKEIETNKVRDKCFMVFALLLVLIVVGTIFLTAVEKLDLVDAFYCVCSTITTLGYGDKSFSTKAGRLFAIFWILISTICLALFFLYVAELNTETRQRALVNWVLDRRVNNVDLEAADLDGDGVVGSAEFILYKLKEMGKINQEDISLVMEEFENLDVDQSGTLSATDITLAQSAEVANEKHNYAK
ncbi:hypothetical protein C3L33_09756, partial [Rhododendron williamsianum]